MTSRQWRSNYILKRAKKFMEKKLYEEAMIMLAEANHREPTLAEGFAAQGLCQLRLEKYNQETIDCFDQAIQLKPNLKNAWYNRGLTKQMIALGEITKNGASNHTIPMVATSLLRSSVDDYTMCIHLDRFFMEAYSNRAACFGKLRNTKRAAADLNKAAQCMDPTSELHSLYNNLMEPRLDVDADGGVDDFAAALPDNQDEIPEGDEAEEENKAETSWEIERRKRLMQLREKSINGKDDLIKILKNRIVVRTKLGQTERAKEDKERITLLMAATTTK